MDMPDPRRREIWDIDFDPATGQEISKIRPALVMNVPDAGRLRLRMVVPITTGHPHFDRYYWMTKLRANANNGLQRDSYADAFQFKSVSVDRFRQLRGALLSNDAIEDVAHAIALCIGYEPASVEDTEPGA